MGRPRIPDSETRRLELRAKASQATKRWRDNHPESRQYRLDWYAKQTPEKKASYHLKANFDISLDDYNEMLVSQSGVCAICKQPETKIRNGLVTMLAVDHDHVTGVIRGLLCHRCNILLGHCNDNVSILASAISYLQVK
jgi:hypothetical protein